MDVQLVNQSGDSAFPNLTDFCTHKTVWNWSEEGENRLDLFLKKLSTFGTGKSWAFVGIQHILLRSAVDQNSPSWISICFHQDVRITLHFSFPITPERRNSSLVFETKIGFSGPFTVWTDNIDEAVEMVACWWSLAIQPTSRLSKQEIFRQWKFTDKAEQYWIDHPRWPGSFLASKRDEEQLVWNFAMSIIQWVALEPHCECGQFPMDLVNQLESEMKPARNHLDLIRSFRTYTCANKPLCPNRRIVKGFLLLARDIICPIEFVNYLMDSSVQFTNETYAKYETHIRKTLHDIIGNPFHPTKFDPDCLTPTTTSLAHTIYHDRRFDLMPILGDALEEAGCTDEAILTHCRGDGPHFRGCWVLDWLLGFDDVS